MLANIGSQTQLKYIKNTDTDDRKQILDRQISETVLDMMREVVHSPDGTGKKARVSGYTTYGRTCFWRIFTTLYENIRKY